MKLILLKLPKLKTLFWFEQNFHQKAHKNSMKKPQTGHPNEKPDESECERKVFHTQWTLTIEMNGKLQEVVIIPMKSYQRQPVPQSLQNCRQISAGIHCEDRNVKLFIFFPLKFFFFLSSLHMVGIFSAWTFIWNLFSLQLWVLLMQLQQVIKMKIIALAKKKFNKRLHQLRLDWSGREKITQNSLFYNSHHIFIYYFALFHL